MTATKPVSQAQQIREVITDAIAQLQNSTDELTIKAITTKAWEALEELVPNENSFRRTKTELRKSLETAYPPSETPTKGYYFTEAGKGKAGRYEHLSLWYATTNKERWNVVGDAARTEYFKNLPPLPTKEVEQVEPQAEPQAEPQVEPQTEVKPLVLELEDMTVESLKLDVETQEMVNSALAQSGMPLADFIQQACRVYARTVTGKARKHGEDLAHIPTRELLYSKSYSTNPNRADELVNRAIRAVMLHNGQTTEASQKWLITQTLLSEMSGSKIPSIKKIMSEKKGAIDDHNQQLKDDCGLNEYSNRKDKLVREQFLANWVDLVSNGLDE